MITTQELIQIIKDMTEDDIDLVPDSSLVGCGSIIDSMGLVQICLALENISPLLDGLRNEQKITQR